ncbi:hypothetical protein P9B03_14105 [Metasolibacillus meyeri]|uniref:Uncharacterized protein n=1 Tax=Metasolibacillus meyeri TaxID=1071052 RepID=A0AAW9NL81_9BACL|nr:hypothetical protein [Metasolibacillus meyeri]MEC1179629.1 hypothetical protein [Metasolibacillus meyeri]
MLIQKRKNLLVSVVILAIFILMLLVYFNLKEPRELPITGDIVSSYNNPDELKQAAELIVEVAIEDTKSINFENVLFTLSKGKVKHNYKGETVDTINILETGGTGEININGRDEKVKMVFEENEVFNENEHAILYLERYEGPIVQDAYVILGVYQGKFKLEPQSKKVIPPNHAGKLEEVLELKDLEL